MKNFKSLFIVMAMLGGTASAHADTPITIGDAKKDSTTAASTDMTDGEIRKVDKDAKKITIKHGEIKNLDMPPMTMAFQVKDPAMLDKVKTGDKIKFRVVLEDRKMVVTNIQAAQ